MAGLTIRPAQPGDRSTIIGLWQASELLRPWNDPDLDIDLAIKSPGSEILLGEFAGRAVATVMVGHDGHRGWLYYLAVDPSCRRQGFGREIVQAAEAWLETQGVRKVQLMVREDNLDVKRFYGRQGYQPNRCHLMQRWLVESGAPGVETAEDGMLDFVITYLEMTKRPSAPVPHPPSGSQVALLRAVRPSVAFYRFLYAQVGDPWLWWERKLLDDDSLAEILRDEGVEIYVLYVGGVPAGYAELDRREDAVIDLAYMGLMPNFIGQALGPYLLASAIDIAWSYEPDKLLVNTNTLDHPKALPLYQRMGFQPYKQEKRRIDDPRLSGLVPG